MDTSSDTGHEPNHESGRNTTGSRSNTRRRGLGRGLGALIVDTQNAPAPDPEDQEAGEDTPRSTGGVQPIPLDHISPNPHQPRTHFDPDALEELAESIRAHGIIQPLIVTASPDSPDHYWLVAGERRWRAAQLALLDQAPAIIREASPLQLVEWALVENLQRADLNPLEEATAYQTLIDEFAMTQAEIGHRVGKSRSAIANTLRLLHLPPEVQEALMDGRLSAGHARALLALPDQDSMRQVLKRILARELSVRQTEELVKQILTRPPEQESPEESNDPEAGQEEDPAAAYISFLEGRFREALGTRVSLSRGHNGQGKLVVHFFSEEDLNNLYQLIVGEEELL